MFNKVAVWDPQNFGDHILCTPVYRHLKKDLGIKTVDVLFDPKLHGHRASINFLETNPYVDNLIITNQWDMGPALTKQYNYEAILRSHYGNWVLYPDKHIKDILCDNIENDFKTKIVDRTVDVFLTSADEEFAAAYSGCISFIPFTDFMRNSREWDPATNWLKLGRKFKELGYKVVVLGSPYVPMFDEFINLTGKTTARQAVAVIKNSKLHVCASTFSEIITDYYKMPAVVLSCSSSPLITGYLSNVNMFKDITCWPCFSGRRKPMLCSGKTPACAYFTVDEVFDKCIQTIDHV